MTSSEFNALVSKEVNIGDHAGLFYDQLVLDGVFDLEQLKTIVAFYEQYLGNKNGKQ